MDILLVNTPYLHLYGSLAGRRGAYFPMGLGYVAASLREAGHRVSLLDPDPLRMDATDLARAIGRSRASLVGISTSTPTLDRAFQIARRAKEARDENGRAPFVILGGPHASALPRETLESEPAIDAVCVGEGEETAVELALRLARGDPPRELATVAGLVMRAGDSTVAGVVRPGAPIVAGPPRASIANVDRIPPPARDLVDLSLYRPHVYADRGLPTTTLLTSRGCPFHCTFCASHVTMERPFRGVSPERVVAEIESLARTRGIRDFLIVDDNFAHDRARARRLCDLLIERDLGLGFFCFSRVNRATPELLAHMRRAGFYGVYFGAESAHRRTLQVIRKGQTEDDVAQGVAAARAAGLKTMAGFIIGLPGETERDVAATVEYAIALSPTIGSFNVLVPYPGTAEWDRRHLSAASVRFESFVPKAPAACASGATLDAATLERLMFRAHLHFYSRPSQLWRMVRESSTWGEVFAYARGAWGLALRMLAWALGGRQTGEAGEQESGQGKQESGKSTLEGTEARGGAEARAGGRARARGERGAGGETEAETGSSVEAGASAGAEMEASAEAEARAQVGTVEGGGAGAAARASAGDGDEAGADPGGPW